MCCIKHIYHEFFIHSRSFLVFVFVCGDRAGHETTSNLLTWTLYAASQQPEIWLKCQQEVDSILGRESIDYESLKKLQYIEAVLDESLRLYPSAPLIARQAVKEHTIGDGIVIPVGASILIPIIVAHQNAEQWKDPSVFNPDRFLEKTRRHPAAFIPFAAGPRSCIGMVSCSSQ